MEGSSRGEKGRITWQLIYSQENGGGKQVGVSITGMVTQAGLFQLFYSCKVLFFRMEKLIL